MDRQPNIMYTHCSRGACSSLVRTLPFQPPSAAGQNSQEVSGKATYDVVSIRKTPVWLTISPPDRVQLLLDIFMVLPMCYERLHIREVIVFAWFKSSAIVQYETVIRFGEQLRLNIHILPFVVFMALSGCISSSQRWVIGHSTASSIPKTPLINEVFPTPVYINKSH